MTLKSLIDKTFQEKELYELLLFDVEQNFEKYFSQNLHIYFNRTQNNKIIIAEVVYFKNDIEADNKSRSFIEKKEWFEIIQNHDHINLLLYRLDRTGFVSSIWKDSTRTEDWRHRWADEGPDLGPMTPDEIRQAFMELSGTFIDQQKLQNLKSKKAV